MLKFRSFRARLLTLILALTGVSELTLLLVVARVHQSDARDELHQQIANDRVRFEQLVQLRNDSLAQAAEALSFDQGMRETIAKTDDAATLSSALDSFRGRVKANLAVLLAEDGAVKAETRTGPSAAAVYKPLFDAADQSPQARATGYGMIDQQLYSLTVVGVRAPQIIAWIVVGFRLDQGFVDALAGTSELEITLRFSDRQLASTVEPGRTDVFVSEQVDLPVSGSSPANIILQYSLEKKLEPAKRLERVLMVVGAGSLAVAGILALGIARTVSRPVQRLAAHTEVIAGGDYDTRLDLDRRDELGQLAESFNAMSAGLAERDKVRDLLDKNVSPAVAAQLMREGSALGGEEREVTILFADLRGFTTLSERRAPREVLTLLNRYFDRMSAAIERNGGVIDKFIGDEIMALFGAPVAQPDAPDRALTAALEMVSALAALNQELKSENQGPFAIGVGINTARVVAGNIGSHRRLNYSVIGDGVNVAARLQTLTRQPEHRATIIVSDATRRAAKGAYDFRKLGPVAVKGRAELVEIFAVGT